MRDYVCMYVYPNLTKKNSCGKFLNPDFLKPFPPFWICPVFYFWHFAVSDLTTSVSQISQQTTVLGDSGPSAETAAPAEKRLGKKEQQAQKKDTEEEEGVQWAPLAFLAASPEGKTCGGGGGIRTDLKCAGKKYESRFCSNNIFPSSWEFVPRFHRYFFLSPSNWLGQKRFVWLNSNKTAPISSALPSRFFTFLYLSRSGLPLT